MKYEYQLVGIGPKLWIEGVLNEHAKEGWRYVGQVSGYFIFERLIEDSTNE